MNEKWLNWLNDWKEIELIKWMKKALIKNNGEKEIIWTNECEHALTRILWHFSMSRSYNFFFFNNLIFLIHRKQSCFKSRGERTWGYWILGIWG